MLPFPLKVAPAQSVFFSPVESSLESSLKFSREEEVQLDRCLLQRSSEKVWQDICRRGGGSSALAESEPSSVQSPYTHEPPRRRSSTVHTESSRLEAYLQRKLHVRDILLAELEKAVERVLRENVPDPGIENALGWPVVTEEDVLYPNSVSGETTNSSR